VIDRRRGFAMITILWVIAVAGVVATTGALVGRIAVDAARNRTELDRAQWIAAGCASRVREGIDNLLGAEATDAAVAAVWQTLDRRISGGGRFAIDRACDVRLEATGTRLDVNSASDEMVGRLLDALGVPPDEARRMVDALADWKDSDDVARPNGAEREWYAGEERELPRNAPIADVRELARVRGFERIAEFDSVFATDSGRVSLATAPVPVLMSVPGVTREAADAIVQLRDQGTPVGDLLALVGIVSPSSADSLTARYADAAHVSTAIPDAWTLSVRATSGLPPNVARLDLRLTRDGRRARVSSARIDP
jgi:general secretion pathway protein K